MLRVISFDYSDQRNCDIAFDIRRNVFEEEQKVRREEEFDGFDPDSRHYLVYFLDKPIGTARWRKTPIGIKLERFAVLHEYRNSGAGTAILEEVLKDVLPLKEQIYLHAQIPAVNFYKRAGFVTKGDVFVEANMDHYCMIMEENIN